MKIDLAKKHQAQNFSGAMTDISFLLIIFFIVSAVFIADTGILLRLPGADTGPRKVTRDDVVSVEILAPREYAVNGNTVERDQLQNAFSEAKQAFQCCVILRDAHINCQQDQLAGCKRQGEYAVIFLSYLRPSGSCVSSSAMLVRLVNLCRA